MNSKKIFVFLALLPLIFFSCSGKQEKSDLKISANLLDSTVKQIYYSIPSAIEIGNILKLENFDTTFFHCLDSATRYTSEKSLALNLGIYTADMSFYILFDHHYNLDQYLNNLKLLINKLNIKVQNLDSFVNVIKQDFYNQKKLLQDISNFLYSADASLKEEGRTTLALYVALGAWIEANYLLLHSAKNNSDSNQIYQIIADQRLVIDNILRIIDTFKICGKIKNDILSLSDDFDKIAIKKNITTIDTATGKKITTLKIEYNFKPELIKDLQTRIEKIRNNFISSI